MNVLIFGSTGTVGTQLIKRGLTEGHTITAFARDLGKISAEHERLTKFKGDVLDRLTVDSIMPGHDAVMVVLGAGLKGGVRAAGTLNIIHSMQKHGVKRLICQSTLGAGDSRENLNFFWKHIMFGALLKNAYADHELQERYVCASGLDWTIVRPGAFTDGDYTGKYRHGFPNSDKSTQLKISRADVAEFLLQQLADLQYLHKYPGLSY